MSEAAPIRIMLVDDDRRVHQMVSDLIDAEPDLVLSACVADGGLVVDAYRRVQPDLVLMDVVMPGEGGASITRRLLADYPQATVIALSSFREYEDIKAILEGGAQGYLVKDAMVDDLASTVRLACRGTTVLSPQVTEVLLSPPAQTGDRFNLTDREREVLAVLAEGLTNREAAVRLEISVDTVRFHLKNILRKMGVENRSAALVLAAKVGLI